MSDASLDLEKTGARIAAAHYDGQENDMHFWRIAQASDRGMAAYPAKAKSLPWSADAR